MAYQVLRDLGEVGLVLRLDDVEGAGEAGGDGASVGDEGPQEVHLAVHGNQVQKLLGRHRGVCPLEMKEEEVEENDIRLKMAISMSS